MATQWLNRAVRRATVLLPVLSMSAALTVLSLTSAPPAAAHALDTGNINYVRDLDSPAVVRIVSENDAQVVCQGCSSDGSDYVFPSKTQVYTGIASGSGAFISSDGYILTAYHVVDPTCTDPTNSSGIVNLWENDLQTNYAQYGFNSASDAANFAQNELNQGKISLSCQNTPYSDVFTSNAYSGALQSPGSLVTYKMTQIVQHSPVENQDVAIIKVDVPHDMPYLTFAQASDIQTGENITAIAYPGDADQSDFSVLLNPTQANADVNTLNSLLTPSIDTGQITSQQTLSNGTLTYETSGIAYHGSSGGPAVDAQGRIVGFFDYLTDTSSNRVSVMIASSVAQKYAQEAGVGTPRPGTVMPQWTQAMNAYYGTGPCHFGNAYTDLKQLKDQHPEFGGVENFYLKAEQQQTPTACAQSLQHGPSTGLIAAIAVLVLLLGGGIGGGILVAKRRSAKRNDARVMAPVGAAVNAYAVPAGEQTITPYQPMLPAGQNFQTPYPMNSGGPFMPTPQMNSGGPFTPTPQMNSGGPFTPTPPMTVPPAAPIGATGPTPAAAHEEHAQAPANPAATYIANNSQPLPQAQAVPQATPGPRVCRNGHVIVDPAAHFCPTCGMPAEA